MKAITKLKGILLISLLAAACATTPFKVPDKYNFDNELQEQKEISNFRIDSWQKIDYQSLLIITNINDYYLVILDYPAESLPQSERIGVTVTVDRVKSGLENIIVSDSGSTKSYGIHKIYKLKDREQALEIKKRLQSM
jgi:hypothetical protein